MASIDSFLQKRKMRENHYGVVMILTAYILSMLMLVLGSDAINDIRLVTAGINKTGEETQKSDTRPVLDYLEYTYKPYLLQEQLVNPYSLTDLTTDNNTALAENEEGQDINTLWFLGTEMNDKQFDSLMQEMDDFIEEQAAKKASTAIKSEETLSNAQIATAKEQQVHTVKIASYNKTLKVTTEDVKMLERITQAEASGEDMKGKILIVNVILNRVASDEFPDTIKKVIFQNDDGDYQFSPVKSGKYWKVKISEETKKAVQKALAGEDYSKGALYFMARKHAKSKNAKWFDENLTRLFVHGGHEFFK
jgi:N-acetylmuramoyl-L-alanine amidase